MQKSPRIKCQKERNKVQVGILYVCCVVYVLGPRQKGFTDE